MEDYRVRELVEQSIDSEKYATADYLDGRRWASYRDLIHEVIRIGPETVLEIGPGNRIVSSICTALGFKVQTLDINLAIKPDVVGSVAALPFKARSSDLVIATQVLEHLPFDRFAGIMNDISVIASSAIISLPHVSFHVSLGVKLPTFKWRTICVTLPIASGRIGEPHCWELGMNVKEKEVRRCFTDAGFYVEKSFRTAEHPYHHYFVLTQLV